MRTFTLPVILAATGLVAQPTCQYANVDMTPLGYTVYTITDPGSAVEPSPGANQTWNFSTVVLGQIGTAVLGTSVGTPYAATYPAANFTFAFTITGGATEYNYIAASTNGLETVASHVPSAPNVYTDYDRFLQFPLALGGSYTNVYASPDNTGTQTWTYEGYGTLITPLGTFTNQMKLKNSDGDVVIWNEAPLFPRFIGDSNGTQLFMPGITAVDEPTNNAPTISVYPMPASTQLTVTGLNGVARWTVLDAQGRLLLQGNSTASTDLIPIASLTEGNYVLMVIDVSGRRAVRFQKM